MQPEDIDQLFRQRLQGHAPTPPADLWSRLEAELQPEKKKRPLLWVYSLAAAVALLLVVGAGWLLRGAQNPATTGNAPLATAGQPTNHGSARPGQPAGTAADKKLLAQATPSLPQPSTPATTATTPTTEVATATNSQPLVAAATAADSPALPPTTTRALRQPRTASASNSTTANSFMDVAVATRPAAQPERPQAAPTPATTTPIIVASATPAASTAAPVGPIEVEVRRQAETPTALAAVAPARRPRLGGILRQVRNAVRGDEVNLADAGLPETLTVQARVGGRTLSKTIEL